MKNKLLRILPAMMMVVTLPATIALPRDYENKFYENPIQLNGHPIELSQLSSINSGVITLVKGNPESTQATPVPFLIYLKRAGKVVNAGTYATNQAVAKYQISNILKFAKAGDELIIDPANKTDAAGKRIISVTGIQLIPLPNWFLGMRLKGDGC